MNLVYFTVYGEIKGKERPRTKIITTKDGRQFVNTYTPEQTQTYENKIAGSYIEAANGFYFKDKPVCAIIRCYFMPPKDLKELCSRAEVSIDEIQCTKHLDGDNICKSVLDSLNKVAYDDDKQVVNIIIEKHYSTTDREYMQVTIQEVKTYTVKQLQTKAKIKKPKMNQKQEIKIFQLKELLKRLTQEVLKE